jgi:carbamoyl-phosphate synthase large subunit
MKTITVIITGAGAPGAPGVIKSLRENGKRPIRIVGVDASSEAVGFRLADAGYQIPLASDPNFIDRLLEISKQENALVILPLVTWELKTTKGHYYSGHQLLPGYY